MAAENFALKTPQRQPARRFNEAAAHGRGKPDRAASARRWRWRASMRPRRMAAENLQGHDRPTAESAVLQ